MAHMTMSDFQLVTAPCSFCGEQKRRVVGGRVVSPRTRMCICDACVALALEIVAQHDRTKTGEPADAVRSLATIDDIMLAGNMESERAKAVLRVLRRGLPLEQDVISAGLLCSFCSRFQSECLLFIAGASVFICDACIGDAATTIARDASG